MGEKTLLEEVKEHFRDPENVKKAKKYFEDKRIFNERWVDRIVRKLESVGQEELDILINKLSNWDDDRKNLVCEVYEAVSTLGEFKYDDERPLGYFVYRGWIFEVIIGQGSCYHFVKI